MPPEDEMRAMVNFIYSDPSLPALAELFWQKVAKDRNQSLRSFIDKRKSMEQAVAQIISPSDSQDIQLRKIYARVQQMTNNSYEVSKTNQEEKRANEKDANNVEEVWRSGRGNGMQLTWLFLALAKAAGFDAYGCWVSNRKTSFFNKDSMDENQLNANVVQVNLNGKQLYLDPGAAFVPFGFLPWYETGTAGLRLEQIGGNWMETSLPESAQSKIERHANLTLSGAGDLEGKLNVTYTGLEALRRRVDERNSDETERRSYLEDEIKESVPAASEIELSNKPDWMSSSPTLIGEFKMKVPGWVSAAGHRALLPIGLFSAPEKQLFEHAERVYPVYIPFAFQRIDNVEIQLPSGWAVESLPPDKSADLKLVIYGIHAKGEKGRVELTRNLDVNFHLIDIKYYPALRGFFQTVRTGDEEQVVLQPGTASAAN